MQIIGDSEPVGGFGQDRKGPGYVGSTPSAGKARDRLPDLGDEDSDDERHLARTECRLARPFAEIIQVGDGSGIHYECTHDPSHTFPA